MEGKKAPVAKDAAKKDAKKEKDAKETGGGIFSGWNDGDGDSDLHTCEEAGDDEEEED